MPGSNVTIRGESVEFEAFDIHDTTYTIDPVARIIRLTYGPLQTITLQFGHTATFEKWCAFCRTTLGES